MRHGFLLLAVFCAGCSLLPRAPQAPEPGDPAGLRCWHLEGKIAVRDEAESGSAYFLWQHRDEEFYLRVSGPLGVGAAEAYGYRDRVVMRLKEDQILVGRTAEALVARHFGWRVPFDALDWWARGLPTPGPEAAIETGADGRPQFIHQAGWQVALQEWETFVGYQLPVRLELHQGERRVRVRIRDWQPENCQLDS